MLSATFSHWSASLADIKGIPGIISLTVPEPLRPAIYSRAAASNSLEFGDRTDALVVTLQSASWADAADDDKVRRGGTLALGGY